MEVFLSHLSIIFGFGLAFVLILKIMREQRNPSSTFAWLLAVVLMPYLGVPLYLLFGGRKIRSLARLKNPLYEADRSSDVRFQALEPIPRVLVRGGGPFPTSGNRLKLLTGGEEAYESILTQIEQAQHSIYLMTFILGRDDVGRAIVAALKKRAQEGVQVRLLIDALGSFTTRGRFVRELRAAGGKVGVFLPILPVRRKWSTNLRNHRKLMVIDGKSAVIGGMNLASDYLGPTPDPKRFQDLSVIAEGPVVEQAATLFASDWEFATGEKLARPTAGPLLSEEDCGTMQLVASGPDVSGDPLYYSWIAAFLRASRSIGIVTPYFIPDETMLSALGLAAALGRQVRVLVPRRSNHLLADWARGSFMRQLQDAGVEFYAYSERMLHTKAVLIDDELAIIGSANTDIRSLRLNFEVALYCYDADQVAQLAHHVHELFGRADAFRVVNGAGSSVKEWLEDASRLLAPLL